MVLGQRADRVQAGQPRARDLKRYILLLLGRLLQRRAQVGDGGILLGVGVIHGEEVQLGAGVEDKVSQHGVPDQAVHDGPVDGLVLPALRHAVLVRANQANPRARGVQMHRCQPELDVRKAVCAAGASRGHVGHVEADHVQRVARQQDVQQVVEDCLPRQIPDGEPNRRRRCAAVQVAQHAKSGLVDQLRHAVHQLLRVASSCVALRRLRQTT